MTGKLKQYIASRTYITVMYIMHNCEQGSGGKTTEMAIVDDMYGGHQSMKLDGDA